MALPTIPTSFVPHPVSADRNRFQGNAFSILALFAYGLLVFAFIAAIAVFLYGRVLSASQASKEAQLAKVASSIDQTTIEGFIRLRDRLDSSKTLLANHIALSNFFTDLVKLLPQTVQVSSIHITVDPVAGSVQVEGQGTAKSFNAIAAMSNALATDNRIKDVIFSKITVNTNSTVSFAFTASLDPKLVTYTPTDLTAAPMIPAATSTATTTKP